MTEESLYAKLTELGYTIDRVRQEAEDMKRVLTSYGKKGVTSNSLERLDSQLLELSRIRDDIREGFTARDKNN